MLTALRSFLVVCALLAVAQLSATSAHADKRVALVLGISSYEHVAKLPNPSNDAGAMANLLKKAGFDVVETYRDVGIAALRRAVGDFSDKAQDADVAVVFYAGHGIEVDGTNYLVPADAKLARDFDIEDEALSLDRLLKAIEPAKRLRLVMLDACRDNPFSKTMKRTVASRSVGRGLAKVEPTVSDTLIAFAAKAGSVALDGDNANSPFTTALLENIAVPGVDLRIAFGQVRDSVMAATGRKQEPYVYGSLGGRTIAIVDAPASPAQAQNKPAAAATQVAAAPADQSATPRTSSPAPSSADIAEAWRAVSATSNPAVLEAFVRRFGDSIYGDLARARIQDLKVQQTKVAAATSDERSLQPAQKVTTPAASSPAASAPAATAASTPTNYLGCFKDQGKRDLDGHNFYDRNMTTQLCISTCREKGFSHAGTQYASYCFCGNKFGASGPADNCNAKCTGNRDETCGGTWANSVYKVN
ncbi:caspase family protein [Bradyrhizobium sp. SYSU BS000235]|uniref:caspase family protein n=1 Tax=Bradyrhizobium sp. SYSU BS000235 TaxID=3411332 RepID=UPI003C71BE73